MEKLKNKVRALTTIERRNLLNDGISILNLKNEQQDEAVLKILSLVFTDEDLATVKSFDEENELVNAIVDKTYGIGEADSKN